MHRRKTAEPCGEVKHRRVDHDREETESQDRHREGQELDQRPDHGIHNAENQSYEEVGEDDSHRVGTIGKSGICCRLLRCCRRNLQACQKPTGNPQGQSVDDDSNNEGTHAPNASIPRCADTAAGNK